MEAGTKNQEKTAATPEQLPAHLAMAVERGSMTHAEALKFTVKPAIIATTETGERELPRHLQMVVNAGRMTQEAALKCLSSN